MHALVSHARRKKTRTGKEADVGEREYRGREKWFLWWSRSCSRCRRRRDNRKPAATGRSSKVVMVLMAMLTIRIFGQVSCQPHPETLVLKLIVLLPAAAGSWDKPMGSDVFASGPDPGGP